MTTNFRQKAVYDLLKRAEPLGAREMSVMLGTTYEAVRSALNGLRKRGVAEFSGAARATVWKLTPNAERPPYRAGRDPASLASLAAGRRLVQTKGYRRPPPSEGDNPIRVRRALKDGEAPPSISLADMIARL